MTARRAKEARAQLGRQAYDLNVQAILLRRTEFWLLLRPFSDHRV